MSLKSLRTALNAPATAHESRGLVIYPLGCDNHALPDAASACAGRSGDAKLRLIRKLLKQHALAVGRKLGGELCTLEPLISFLTVLCFFHVSEFCLAACYMRQDLSARSWLISTPYCAAMLGAVLEYLLETSAFPALKVQEVSYAGCVLIALGEAIRKTAMVTARHNFTHVMQRERRESHTLITHGIYRYMRHPGYLGFFIWCVGTQLLLVNPVCCVVFTLVVWRFFKERIEVEEQHLYDFFGPEYNTYARKTPAAIPFIP